MTLKYILIKLFFAEFSHMKYMKWGGLYLLALYDGIPTQHPKNQCIENQSGATAFFTSNTFKRTTPSRLC